MGSITVFGSRDYSMRVWLDPQRLQSLGLTAQDVVQGLQAQNVQVASGVLNQPPVEQPGAFQIAVRTQGRLAEPGEFGNIVVKQTETAVVRIKDVAKVELAALDYSTNSYLDRDPAVGIGIFQRPGSNALSAAKAVQTTMDELSKSFPSGLKYTIIYNPTEFIQQSVDAVIHTIGEAVILVVLVVVLFLQTWRAAVIPLVAIPVSLVGTFFIMTWFGFSLNNLSLFGLVLRHRHRGRRRHRCRRERRAQHRGGAYAEGGCAQEHGRGGLGAHRHRVGADGVFLPSVFITGISGQFYRQFRAHHRGRDRDFADRVADAVAGHVRAAPASASRAPQLEPAPASAARLFLLLQPRVRWAVERLTAASLHVWYVSRHSCSWPTWRCWPMASTSSGRHLRASFRSRMPVT